MSHRIFKKAQNTAMGLQNDAPRSALLAEARKVLEAHVESQTAHASQITVSPPVFWQQLFAPFRDPVQLILGSTHPLTRRAAVDEPGTVAQLGAPVAAVAAGIAGPGRVEPNWICGQRDVGPSDPDLVDGRSQGQHERASYPRGIPQTPAGPLATRDPGRKAEPQHPGRSASGTPDATLFVQHLSAFVYLSLLSPSPPTTPLAAPNPSRPSHRVRTIAPLTCLCPSRPPKAPLPELQRTPTPYGWYALAFH